MVNDTLEFNPKLSWHPGNIDGGLPMPGENKKQRLTPRSRHDDQGRVDAGGYQGRIRICPQMAQMDTDEKRKHNAGPTAVRVLSALPFSPIDPITPG